MAVGKSGWLGTGWYADASKGNSLHASGFIPQATAHNDYIFAVIAEEQGFRGSLLLLTSFALLLVLCLFVGAYARDPLGRNAGLWRGARRDRCFNVAFDDPAAGSAALNALEVESACRRHSASQRG